MSNIQDITNKTSGSSYTAEEFNNILKSSKHTSRDFNFILAGQSNAVSRASSLLAPSTVPDAKYLNTSNQFVDFSSNVNGSIGMNYYPDQGGGVEYRLAEMLNTNIGKRVNMLKYAKGGSRLGDGGEWNIVDGTLTSGLISAAKASNVEFDVFIWIQGENDSTSSLLANTYEDNLTGFINHIRANLNRNMLFVIVRLFDFTAGSISVNSPIVRTAQDNVASKVYETIMVQPQENAGLKPDGIHFNENGIDGLAKEIYKVVTRYT